MRTIRFGKDLVFCNRERVQGVQKVQWVQEVWFRGFCRFFGFKGFRVQDVRASRGMAGALADAIWQALDRTKN